MKPGIRITAAWMLGGLLSACSSVDSLRVFDHQQAAILLQQNYIATPAKQMIALTLPEKNHWQRIDLSHQIIGTPIMLLPKHESPQSWHESIRTRISGYINDPSASTTKLLDDMIEYTKNACQRVDASILSKTNDTLIYQASEAHCTNGPNRQQIGKIFRGEDAIYAVYYSAASSEISKQHFEKMAVSIKTARLVRNTFD